MRDIIDTVFSLLLIINLLILSGVSIILTICIISGYFL